MKGPESIRRESPIPIYHQLVELVKSKVRTGEWRPGDYIPSEEQICEAYDISRGPVRQAIGQLVQEGLLVRERGKGTRVALPKMARQVTQYMAIFEEIERSGLSPRCHVIEQAVVQPPAHARTALQLDEGEPTVRLQRIFTGDDEPLCLAKTYLPARRFPGLIDEDLRTSALWRVMTEKYSIPVTKAAESYEVTRLAEPEARRLQADPSLPALLLKLLLHSPFGPVEYSRIWLRGDRYRIHLEHSFITQGTSRHIARL